MYEGGTPDGGPSERKRGKACHQAAHGYRQLHPGQRRPNAEVDATAEGDVRIRFPADIELVGPLENLRVTVGRTEQSRDPLPRPHDHSPDLHVGHGGPFEKVQWRVEAEELLGCGGGQFRRPLNQPPLLLGVAQQRDHAVAEAVDAGLVPGVEQYHDRGNQLVLGQPVALLLRLDEMGDQVVVRTAEAFGGKGAHVGAELGGRLPGRGLLRGTALVFVHLHQIRRPRAQQMPVAVGNTEQLRDDHHRQWFGELADQVEGLPVLRSRRDAVEQDLAQLVDVRPQSLDVAAGEGLAQ